MQTSIYSLHLFATILHCCLTCDLAFTLLDAKAAYEFASVVVCRNIAASAYLGYECDNGHPHGSNVPATTIPYLSDNETYGLNALAIGDWGVDPGLGSCCNKYRKTGIDTEAYYKDRQAQPNVAHLLELSAEKLRPQVVISHGDNFYWNGVGSKDWLYRFTTSYEYVYNQWAILPVKWINVMGNHDYGGSMFICGTGDGNYVECTSTADLLKNLDQKFTRQANYRSPYNDRWQMPARFYIEHLEDLISGVTVDIFNVDTNAANVHGGEQICCQCYGYWMKYGGTVNCEHVHRDHAYCAGGNNDMFDACLAKLTEWQNESLFQLAENAKSSTATWRIVNSHYSPHFHMNPVMMQEWFNVLNESNIQLFINGHTHAESHEYASFQTHFVTNGAGGGIQSESIGNPPPYATGIETVWIGHDSPYGIFELSFSTNQMQIQFITFDDKWKFKKNPADTVKGGAYVDHCWLIPRDGSKGRACAKTR